MKILDVPQSGKSGTSVSVQGRYGQFRRQLVIPKDPRTRDQVRVRLSLGRISARWNSLTEEQRGLWIAFAGSTRSRPRLGKSGRLTGQQLFVKINCTLASIGEPLVDVPPERPQFAANPVGSLSITNTRGAVALRLSVSKTPGAYIIVRGAAPCSQGVSFVRHFRILGRLPAPAAGASDITDMYVERFGVPRPGSRVFIHTNQQISGWEDGIKQTTAIVPRALSSGG
jgi:hypothetical protein